MMTLALTTLSSVRSVTNIGKSDTEIRKMVHYLQKLGRTWLSRAKMMKCSGNLIPHCDLDHDNPKNKMDNSDH